MQGKEQKIDPSPSETKVKGFQSFVRTNVSAVTAGGSHGKQCYSDDSESFYIKLTELLESSGLTLIFNVRETLLNLYLFYSEVTRRGGYHQVGREKKWGEVVSALKLEGSNVKLSAQVEKLYAHLLYQFEQLYFYRSPANQAAASGAGGPLKRKRNSTASLSQSKDIKDGEMVTNVCKDCSCQMTGAGFVEQPVLLLSPSDDKKMKKRKGAPMRRKSAYQIFLKQECARLKACSQASDGSRILRMAVDAWKKMSEIEKQPYVEESKKNKEKFNEAMIPNNKLQSMQDTRVEKRPSPCGDYHVTSQPEAPQDPLFLIDLDAYVSLDLPTEESK